MVFQQQKAKAKREDEEENQRKSDGETKESRKVREAFETWGKLEQEKAERKAAEGEEMKRAAEKAEMEKRAKEIRVVMKAKKAAVEKQTLKKIQKGNVGGQQTGGKAQGARRLAPKTNLLEDLLGCSTSPVSERNYDSILECNSRRILEGNDCQSSIRLAVSRNENVEPKKAKVLVRTT